MLGFEMITVNKIKKRNSLPEKRIEAKAENSCRTTGK
jgi:hypothetical protein